MTQDEERAMWMQREERLLDRIDRLTNQVIVLSGQLARAAMPAPSQAAERQAHEPDAEERVRTIVEVDVAAANAAMQEERIAIGAKDIMEMYREQGVPIDEAEARMQAEAMLGGRSPVGETFSE